MKVSELLEQIIKIVNEDYTVMDLDVTLAGLEYTCGAVELRQDWEETKFVLDIF